MRSQYTTETAHRRSWRTSRSGARCFARKRARTYPLDWQSLVGPMSAKDVRYEMERNVAKAADAIVRRLG